MKEVWIDDDGVVQTHVATTCTGIAATWCPIHGDCTCPGDGYRNHPDCPLHSRQSDHAERPNVRESDV